MFRTMTELCKSARGICLCMCAAALLAPPAMCAAGTAKHPAVIDEYQDLQGPSREEFLPVTKVIEGLNLHPGMCILDLGAGKGYFTFPIAEALGGTGMVYATDIDPASIGLLHEKALQRGLKNICPVLVKSNDDPFYQEKSFDLILLSEVCCFFEERVALFRQLRERLRPGGRIVIIDVDVKAGFYGGNFEDMGRICREIRKAGAGFPLFERLSPQLQEHIRGGDLSAPLSPALRALLIGDFNRVLADTSFFTDMDLYMLRSIGNETRSIAQGLILNLDPGWYVVRWLAYQLKQNGTLEKTAARMSAGEKESVAMLNQLLLRQMFRKGFNSHYFIPTVNMSTPRTIMKEMRRAGLSLAREHDTLPFHFFVEYTPAHRFWKNPFAPRKTEK